MHVQNTHHAGLMCDRYDQAEGRAVGGWECGWLGVWVGVGVEGALAEARKRERKGELI